MRHGVGVQRFIAGRARELREEWRRIVDGLGAILVAGGIDPLPGQLEATKRRVGEANQVEYRRLGIELSDDRSRFADSEASFGAAKIRGVVPGELEVRDPPPAAVEGASRDLVEGATLAGWLATLSVQQTARISKTVDDVLERGGDLADVLKILPRAIKLGLSNLESLVRSAFGGTAAAASDAVSLANGSMFQGVLWSGVLDSRITPHLCLPRDGKLYSIGSFEPIGHSLGWGAGPGRLHYRCRSISVPVFHNGDVLGLEGQTRRTKEAFDGTVPIRLSAQDWLRTRPRSDVEAVFGKARASLWLRGELSAEEMLRADGGSLKTLEELAAFDAQGVG